MAHDDGSWKLIMKPFQQRSHGLSLGLGARIAGIARSIQTTLVADADAVLVMTFAMGSDLLEWTSLMRLTVARDVVMIADILPPALQVVGLALPEAVLCSCPRAAAVQHN